MGLSEKLRELAKDNKVFLGLIQHYILAYSKFPIPCKIQMNYFIILLPDDIGTVG